MDVKPKAADAKRGFRTQGYVLRRFNPLAAIGAGKKHEIASDQIVRGDRLIAALQPDMREARSRRAARVKRVFDRCAVIDFVGDDRVGAIPIADRGFAKAVFVFPNAQFLTIRQETLNVIGEGSCDRDCATGLRSI